MKIKKMKKKYYSQKNPTKLSSPMRAKSDKIFLLKRKKKTCKFYIHVSRQLQDDVFIRVSKVLRTCYIFKKI